MSCFREIADFIEKETSDDEKFDAIKKLFLSISTEKVSDRIDPLPYQLMKKCRDLSSGELLVLLTSYRLSKTKNNVEGNLKLITWENLLAEETGLKFKVLIQENAQTLSTKKLLYEDSSFRGNSDLMKKNFRVTDFGMELCKHIENYEVIKEELKDEKV